MVERSYARCSSLQATTTTIGWATSELDLEHAGVHLLPDDDQFRRPCFSVAHGMWSSLPTIYEHMVCWALELPLEGGGVPEGMVE